MDYDFDAGAAGAGTLKVTALAIKRVDTQGNLLLATGAAYTGDSTLGAPVSTSHTIGVDSWGVFDSTSTVDTLAGLPAAVLTEPGADWIDIYVLPYSTTLNPDGYTYQTFGTLVMPKASFFSYMEAFYSVGVTTSPATLPTSGSAGYVGQATASYVDTISRDPYDVVATVDVSVDLAMRTATFATTGTTALSANSTPGSLPSAATNLNMSGTLSYLAGSNTFTGVVTTGSGMSGNVTGRLYGPGIAAATPNKVVGSPPEIGGTFVLMKSGVGVLQGSFGGK